MTGAEKTEAEMNETEMAETPATDAGEAPMAAAEPTEAEPMAAEAPMAAEIENFQIDKSGQRNKDNEAIINYGVNVQVAREDVTVVALKRTE
jgi:hypothetical protein